MERTTGMFIGGLALGIGIAALAAYLLHERVMQKIRGDQPLPGGMDAKLERFGYEMLEELTR